MFAMIAVAIAPPTATKDHFFRHSRTHTKTKYYLCPLLSAQTKARHSPRTATKRFTVSKINTHSQVDMSSNSGYIPEAESRLPLVMRRYLPVVMVMVCHDIGIASVMALIVRPPATRRSAPRLGQKWTCQKISLYDLNRRRSFSPCYPGTTQSRNPQPLSLTSTEQRFADGANNNQNTTTSWDPPKRRRVITRISSQLELPSSLQRRLVGLMTGHATTVVDEGGSLPLSMRPGWARDWMPTWMTCLRPSMQLLAAFLLYLFHTLYLTQASIPLPFQLIPNERGNFQSVGLDS